MSLLRRIDLRSWSHAGLTIIRDEGVISRYIGDESRIIWGSADAVYYPRDETQVSRVIVKANRNGWRVTVSGGGTGLTGSRVPLGGIVMSMEYMMSVSKEAPGEETRFSYGGMEYKLKYYFSEDDGLYHVVAPVGMTVEAFIEFLSNLGLVYPPNPTEKTAFLGGNLGTHASGKWTFKFGLLRNYVHRLRIVLPDGGAIELRRGDYTVDRYLDIETEKGRVSVEIPLLNTPKVKKSSAWPNISIGMDLIDLFVGMEGILGVYTEVEYALPRASPSLYSIFSVFKDESSLVEAVRELRKYAKNYDVWAVEYMDYRCINFIRERLGRDFPVGDDGGILYIDVGGDDETIFENLSNINELLESNSSVETYASDDPRWVKEAMHIRHLIPESVNNFISLHHTHRVASDASFPDDQLKRVLDLYRKVGDSSGINYLIYGHIGDSHLHFNFLPKNRDELRESLVLLTSMLKKIVSWGGCVTAEHGFGKKIVLDEDGDSYPLVYLQYGDKGLEKIRSAKEAMDPKLLLNVGNIVPIDK